MEKNNRLEESMKKNKKKIFMFPGLAIQEDALPKFEEPGEGEVGDRC